MSAQNHVPKTGIAEACRRLGVRRLSLVGLAGKERYDA